jgi:hypothetical protein
VARSSKKNNKNLGLFLFIAAAIFVTVALVSQKTSWFNFAKGPGDTPAIDNLNSAYDIVATNNPDGTMGPATFSENASQALPDYLKGSLFFNISSNSRDVLGANSSLKANQNLNKNSAISDFVNLFIVVKKIEVHLAQQGDPNVNRANIQKLSRWETLDLETPMTLNLLKIAEDESPILVAVSELAAGRYTQIRLYIDRAYGEFANEDLVEFEIPGNNDIVKVVKTFKIDAGEQTSLTLEFDPEKSVIKTGSKYFLKPVIGKMLVE